MNNKIIAGIVVVIIVAAGIFLATRHKGGKSEVASSTQTTSSAATTSAQSGSIKSLIAAGKTQKCTFSTTKDNYSSNGTVYVGGGKLRGDFSVNTSQSMTHMINDGKTSYMWDDSGKFAIKMAFDPADTKAVANANTQAQQGADVNANYDWSCDSWKIDNSKFDLPSGVTFNELPAMPSGGAAAGAGAGASAASTTDVSAIRKQACNSLSSPAKEQCLAAIK